MKTTHRLPEGFELSAAQEFYQGFKPGEGMAAAGQSGSSLTFVFLVERSFEAAEVTVTQHGRKADFEVNGPGDAEAATRQAKRMLGLDADGAVWLGLGKKDPVVGKLQSQFPGFFTATFASPYEAGVGGILAQRISTAQAATIRRRLSEHLGEKLGDRHTLPRPQRLLELRELPGLPSVKVSRLHAIAEAALDGTLDAERLRAMDAEAAMEELQLLPGIGPWTAGHIFARGAAPFDFLPKGEPRVLRGAALAYGLSALTEKKYEALAEQWRPFRMWVTILLMRSLSLAGQWATQKGDLRGRRWSRALA